MLQEFLEITSFTDVTWQMVAMWIVCGVLTYLAIVKQFEPMLLLPIAFGAMLANLPSAEVLLHPPIGEEPGGLFYYLSLGIKWEIFPPLIFLGVGALTDFGPLIANPRTLLLGAAAQAGVLITFIAAYLVGFTPNEAASIGIIGGADGPTSIFIANKLAPSLVGPIAVAAYSYMALVPLIQPPIMRLLTTDKERRIRMASLRKVSKLERLLFAFSTLIICILIVPSASALISMLMLGNILRESGVVERLSNAAQNEIINVVTIFLAPASELPWAATIFCKPRH